VTPDLYTDACKKLIAQYKTLKEALGDQADVVAFTMKYSLNCNAAVNRYSQFLIIMTALSCRFKMGVPATTVHFTPSAGGRDIHIFHAVQHFITAMDSLKLEMKCVDELHPSFRSALFPTAMNVL